LLNRKILHNKVCVATQTENICIPSTSSACQTEPTTKIAALKNKEQKPAVMLAPKIGTGLYPCRIGSCSAELPYGRIIGHLRYYHKNMFYEVLLISNFANYTVMINKIRTCQYHIFFII
jgi:hypothetical protein